MSCGYCTPITAKEIHIDMTIAIHNNSKRNSYENNLMQLATQTKQFK